MPDQDPKVAFRQHGNGHPYFYELCEAVQILHDRKNRDYAHGGSPLGNFERVSQLMQLYPNMDWSKPEGVACVYMFKQLDAYLWMKNCGHGSVTGEGLLERLKDILVYSGILSCIERDKADVATRNFNPETTSAERDHLYDSSTRERANPAVDSQYKNERITRTPGDPSGWHGLKRPSQAAGGTDTQFESSASHHL